MQSLKIDLTTIPVFKETFILYNLLKDYGEIRLVGGCIRDILLNITPKDVDFATTILPQKVIEVLSHHQIQCFPTGIEFGTVTAVINHIPFEITTLRKDISTDGRKTKVQFTTDWLEDAKRRDFTINALYCDISGNITDFFGGIQDLIQRELKFIGNPEERIQEDFLRILRYFRFIAYVGSTKIDSDSFNATIKLKYGLGRISGERIRSEMFKLLSNQFVINSFSLLQQTGIDLYICLPVLKRPSKLNFLIGNAIVNLAIILKIYANPEFDFSKLRARWKLSNAEIIELSFLLHHVYPIDLEDNINLHQREYYKYPNYFQNTVLLKGALANNVELSKAITLANASTKWCFPDFPITGNDLKSLGITGKEISKIKQLLLTHWINSDFSKNKEYLLSLAQQLTIKSSI